MILVKYTFITFTRGFNIFVINVTIVFGVGKFLDTSDKSLIYKFQPLIKSVG